MNKLAYFYCDPRSINDATFHYIDLIKKALVHCGYELITIHNIKDCTYPSLIVTITEKYFFFAKLKFPFTKTLYWSQGIGPEETLMSTNKRDLRYYFRTFAERFAVLKADYLLFVSNSMLRHYSKKYNFKKKNYYVIPCYNMPLNDLTKDPKRYTKPTFVYAGGATIWQCVTQMLDTYKIVEDLLPNAFLTIYSSDKEYFQKEIEARKIKNFKIDYVSKETLNERLSQFKYAFLLRENHPVNNVATPTKMNSYLANYLLPIYTSAVHDFAENIELGNYTLCFKTPISPNLIANRIFEFEKNVIDINLFEKKIKLIFENHYNDKKNVEGIIDLLNQ